MQDIKEKNEYTSKQTVAKSDNDTGFAVIYRSYLKADREEEYQKAWQIVAQYFQKHRGAIGSTLHKTSDGMWIAYSRWPDKKTRDASWPGENAPTDELPFEIRKAVKIIQDCLDPDRKLPEICMEVVQDLLLNEPDSPKQDMSQSFTILPFEDKYQQELINLVDCIQVKEFNIPIEEAQRKELQTITQSFHKDKSNYWLAIYNGKVIGSIAVIDIGHNAFELRDVFLAKEYRGSTTGFAKKLLDTVLTWSKENEVKTIYLGTTLAFQAAHRFYEKHGFVEIAKKEMPSYCQPMDCDEKFYRLDL